MRVHERGVGETRSCGTGTVAAAVAALRHAGREPRGRGAIPTPGGGSPSWTRRQPAICAAVVAGVRWELVRTTGGGAATGESDAQHHSISGNIRNYMTLHSPTRRPSTGRARAPRGAHALRRVAGLSTELEDVTEVEYRQLRLERVVLVGVWTEGTVAGRRELAGRAGRCSPRPPAPRCSTALIQRRDKPDPATYIGSRQGRRAARHRASRPAPTP